MAASGSWRARVGDPKVELIVPYWPLSARPVPATARMRGSTVESERRGAIPGSGVLGCPVPRAVFHARAVGSPPGIEMGSGCRAAASRARVAMSNARSSGGEGSGPADVGAYHCGTGLAGVVLLGVDARRETIMGVAAGGFAARRSRNACRAAGPSPSGAMPVCWSGPAPFRATPRVTGAVSGVPTGRGSASPVRWPTAGAAGFTAPGCRA